MQYTIFSLFPELFEPFKSSTLISKALSHELLKIDTRHLREYSINTQNQVDDAPYGGGGGMVLIPEVARDAVLDAKKKQPRAQVILFSPRGRPMKQDLVREIVQKGVEGDGCILLCNR